MLRAERCRERECRCGQGQSHEGKMDQDGEWHIQGYGMH